MSKKPTLAAVKSALHKDKFKHGSLSVAFTAIFIAVIIVVNILVSALTDRFPSMNFDLTLEGLNTLSEDALDVAKNIENETTIYIIGAEDAIRGDQVYSSYGLQYSQVANLADRLAEANSKIKVEFIDPDRNPSFVSEYSEEALASGKVLVKTEKRYKVLGVTDMFNVTADSETGEYLYYSMVDGALANALYLVNLDNVPVVALATGHGEMLSSEQGTISSLSGLLEDNNFLVEEFNILTEEIPEDASIVFIGTPTADYTHEEIAKLEAFISDPEMASSRTLYFTGYPTQNWDAMPNLRTFLNEWGLNPTVGVIQESDSTRYMSTGTEQAVYILADVNSDVLNGSYSNLIMPASSAVECLFKANNEIVTYSLVQTADTAYVTGTEEAAQEDPDTDVYSIVAMGQRYMNDAGSIQANVVMDGCSMNYTDSFLGNTTFGNKALVTDLFKMLSNTNDTRVGLTVSQTQTNTLDVTASAAVIYLVGLVFFVVILPIAVLAAGLVVFLRRRHL